MRNAYYIIFLLAILFISCGKEKRKPVYYDSEITEEESLYAQSGDEVVVPYRSEDGVKYVKVTVNGVDFDMIFDTGCSGTLISVAEANYLYQKGALSEGDFIGVAKSQIADGSIVENMVVNLKEVVIDNRISCSDVKATVSGNVQAPLLLGNEVLDRVATITIDNTDQTLKFNLK